MSGQSQQFQFAFVSADNVSYLSTPITFYPSKVTLDCMKPNSFGIFSIDYLNKCPVGPILDTSHELPNIVLDATAEIMEPSVIDEDSVSESVSDSETITPKTISSVPKCSPEPPRIYTSNKTGVQLPEYWYREAFNKDIERAYKMTRNIKCLEDRIKVWSKMPLSTEDYAVNQGVIKSASRSRKHWVTLCLLLIDPNHGVKDFFTKKELRSLKYTNKAKIGDFTKYIAGKSWRHWCGGRHLKPYGDRYVLLW